MKKNLIPFVLLALLTFVPVQAKVHAIDDVQPTYPGIVTSDSTTAPATPPTSPSTTNTNTSQYDCSSINSITSYNICCAPNGGGTSDQCDAYEQANPALTTVPGQIGGGTQTTNPINSGASSNLGTTNATYPGVVDSASSCSAIQFRTLLDFAIWAKCIIGAIVIPGIFTLAFVVFLWGVFKFIRASDKADKHDISVGDY
jgi:hypothetical protein